MLKNIRLQVALTSIIVGVLILALKYIAYMVSGSTALLSDAIESVVNVVAAIFAFGAVKFAERPADKQYPYGYGKIEYFSAAFEGGLIALAAVMIWYEAAKALYAQYHGDFHIHQLGLGLGLNLLAGLANGALGFFLVRMGRKHESRAIEADGHHVLSDFWTTLGLCAALLLVNVTGLEWLDPIMAVGVGLLLAFTGFKLVRSASQALLDMEDPDLIQRLVTVMNQMKPADIITVHELRTMRSGRQAYVDVHLVIPEFYSISKGHDIADEFAKQLQVLTPLEGELHTHTDPCQRNWCRQCAVADCPMRLFAYEATKPLTLENVIATGDI